jgi:hypothetical protein
MKHLNAILILVILVLVCYSCSRKSDKDSIETKTDITKIIDSLTNESLNSKIENLETDGDINDSITILKEGINDTVKTVYEINGNIYKLNGKVKRMSVLHYNKKGGDHIVINDQSVCWSNEIDFYEDGTIKGHDFYKACGGGTSYASKFDSVGNPVLKYFQLMSADYPFTKEICTYDNKSRLVKSVTLDYLTNELYSFLIISYDDNNKSKVAKSYDANGTIKSKTHDYFNGRGEVVSHTYYTYLNDSITSESTSFYSYEYDSMNNLIIEYQYSKEGLENVIIQTITYYSN